MQHEHLLWAGAAHGNSRKTTIMQLLLYKQIKRPMHGTTTLHEVSTAKEVVYTKVSLHRQCGNLRKRSRPFVVKLMHPLEEDDNHRLRQSIGSDKLTIVNIKSNGREGSRESDSVSERLNIYGLRH